MPSKKITRYVEKKTVESRVYISKSSLKNSTIKTSRYLANLKIVLYFKPTFYYEDQNLLLRAYSAERISDVITYM